jgi:hypothetical protein
VADEPCLNYVRRGMKPFPECRHAVGHFGSCCGNCKWRDHAVRCSLYSREQRAIDGGTANNDDNNDDNNTRALLPAGTADNPIELD